jgi:hypothetical protein
MQGGPNTLGHPFPIAFAQRPGLAAPVDRPQWDHAEPESEPDPCADSNADTRANAQVVTLELAYGEEACGEKIRPKKDEYHQSGKAAP